MYGRSNNTRVLSFFNLIMLSISGHLKIAVMAYTWSLTLDLKDVTTRLKNPSKAGGAAHKGIKICPIQDSRRGKATRVMGITLYDQQRSVNIGMTMIQAIL